MSFNTDLNKQAQEVIFSKKLKKSSHLGMYLDEALNFNLHIKEKCLKH